MIQLFATKKLLNMSGEHTNAYVSAPVETQQLHDWYVTVTSSSYSERFFVLYVHRPSMMAVVTRGSSIWATYPVFLQRLQKLMVRSGFPSVFIGSELTLASGHAVASAMGSKMVQELNRLSDRVAHWSGMAGTYDLVNDALMEDRMMAYPHSKGFGKYTSAIGYWEDRLGFKCVGNHVLP